MKIVRFVSMISVLLAPAVVLAQHGRGMGGGMHSQVQAPHSARAANFPQGPHMPVTSLTSNPALVTRLTPLLPPGTTLAADAAGFKNSGQFIAALHVSQNLGIPFADLKAAMTGSTPMSLGQAIQSLRPTLTKGEVKSDLKTARRQAHEDLEAGETPDKDD